MDLTLATTGATLATCVFAVIGVHSYAAGKAEREDLVDRLSMTGQVMTYQGRRRRFPGVDRWMRKTKLGRAIERKIAVTGLDMTPGEYSVYTVAGLVVVYAVMASVFASFFGLIGVVVGLWGSNAFLNYQRTKRTVAFINQLPELTRILANATQAGLALRTAISMAADELDDPAGQELRQVADELAVGRSLDDAMNELSERLPSRELTVLVTTLILSNRAGGTIVSSLRNLTETLEERKETRREVTTLLAQVKVTAVAVPLLGLGFLLIVNGMRAGALTDMTNSFVGRVAVIISAALYGLGFFLINRMTRVQV